jgi:hypothetical protein
MLLTCTRPSVNWSSSIDVLPRLTLAAVTASALLLLLPPLLLLLLLLLARTESSWLSSC